MATASRHTSGGDARVFSMNELKEALMKCSVCRQSDGVEKTTLQWKLLSCHHTVCRDCLNHLIEGRANINCPECREVTLVPPEGVDGIPNNFHAARILDFALGCKPLEGEDEVGTRAGNRCGGCKGEILTRIKHQCITCGHLCDTCTWKHRDSMTAPRGRHTIFNLPVTDGDNSGVTRSDSESNFCSPHNHCRVVLFCTLCQAAVCRMCSQLDHGRHHHSIFPIDEVAEESVREIEALLDGVLARQALVFQTLSNVRREEEQVKTKTERVKQKLAAFFSECRDALAERERVMVASADHQSKQLRELLLYSKEEAQDLCARIGSSLAYRDQIKTFEHDDRLAVIRASRALKPALLDIQSTEINTDVACANYTFSTGGNLLSDLATFKHLISLIGQTDTSEFSG